MISPMKLATTLLGFFVAAASSEPTTPTPYRKEIDAALKAGETVVSNEFPVFYGDPCGNGFELNHVSFPNNVDPFPSRFCRTDDREIVDPCTGTVLGKTKLFGSDSVYERVKDPTTSIGTASTKIKLDPGIFANAVSCDYNIRLKTKITLPADGVVFSKKAATSGTMNASTFSLLIRENGDVVNTYNNKVIRRLKPQDFEVVPQGRVPQPKIELRR